MMTHTDATELLKRLIAIPSVSRDEKAVADFLEEQLKQQGLFPMRHHNNLWCVGRAQLPKPPHPAAQCAHRHGKARRWLAVRPIHAAG